MADAAIRRAGPGDAGALSLVGAASFLETFVGLVDGADIRAYCADRHSSGFYADWLASPSHALFLAEVAPGAAPVGYAALGPADIPVPDPKADDLEIKRIYLLSRFHGGGVGRALMEAALDEARARGAQRALLGVKDDNHRAIAFYRKCGFDVVGTRRFHVGAGTYSDLVFAKAL